MGAHATARHLAVPTISLERSKSMHSVKCHAHDPHGCPEPDPRWIDQEASSLIDDLFHPETDLTQVERGALVVVMKLSSRCYGAGIGG
jgi:hypothetical protein